MLALAAAATAAFGVAVWGKWWAVTATAQAALADGAVGFAKMQSLFAALRLLGVPTGAAYAAQLVLAGVVAAVLARLAWRHGFTTQVGAAVLAGTVLATPFVLDYDLVVLAFPIALLARAKPLAWERSAAALAFIVPAVGRSLALLTGAAIMVPAAIGLFAVLARRADLANGGRSKD